MSKTVANNRKREAKSTLYSTSPYIKTKMCESMTEEILNIKDVFPHVNIPLLKVAIETWLSNFAHLMPNQKQQKDLTKNGLDILTGYRLFGTLSIYFSMEHGKIKLLKQEKEKGRKRKMQRQ